MEGSSLIIIGTLVFISYRFANKYSSKVKLWYLALFHWNLYPIYCCLKQILNLYKIVKSHIHPPRKFNFPLAKLNFWVKKGRKIEFCHFDQKNEPFYTTIKRGVITKISSILLHLVDSQISESWRTWSSDRSEKIIWKWGEHFIRLARGQ